MKQTTNTIKEEKGVQTLLKNGTPAVCPFRTPIVLPGQLQGQVQIMPHACNSQCPHFDLREIDGMITTPAHELELTCGNGVIFPIDKDQPTEKPDQAKKIIM